MRLRTALGVFLTLGLAACAAPAAPPGPNAGEQELKETTQPLEGAQCELGKEHWRTAGPPKRGGVWNIAGQAPHMDPTAGGGRFTYHSGAMQYLVQPRACFYADMAMVPSLAKAWQVSPDGRAWAFQLRDDVKWHNLPPVNGRPFTSADVAWSVEHQKGGGAMRTFWQDVTVETPGPHAVVFRLKEPFAEFFTQVGDERNVMLAREVKEQVGDYKGSLIGTGPYMFKQFNPDQLFVLQRNPDYYEMGEDGKALPYLDEIHLIHFPDTAAELAATRTGQLDRNNNTAFRKHEFDALKQSNPELQPFPDLAANVYGVWMNNSIPPFSDVRVRKAISLALDRDDLIGVHQGGAVYGGFQPAATGGEHTWPQDKLRQVFKKDLERARQLLKEAGFTPNPDKPFVMKTGRSYVEELEVVQNQLGAIGIHGRIEPPASNAVTPIISKGDWDIAYGPFGGGRLPDFWLGQVLRSGSSRNPTRWGDPKLDGLIDAQVREMDPEKRKQQLAQIQERLLEELPWVPAITRVYYRFDSCQTRNMRPPHNSLNTWGLVHAWLDPSGC